MRLRRAAGLLVLFAAFAPGARGGSSSEALDHYHRGAALYARGELEPAISEFRSALALDSGPHKGARVGMHFEDYDPQFQIGRIQARLGRFDEARKMFEACAASGYTEKSENGEEFRRWRAIVQQAVAAATPAPVPKPPPATVSAPPPASSVSEPPPPAAPSPAAAVPAPPRPPASAPAPASATAQPPPRTEQAPPASTGEIVPVPAPAPAETAGLRLPASLSPPTLPPAPRRPAPVPEPRLPLSTGLWIAAAAAALLLGGWAAFRGRHGDRETAELSFGRYAIGDLIAAGRHSFVYGASDRKTGERVALKLRRVSKPAGQADRFEREAQALELFRRAPAASLGPRPVARGSVRSPAGAIEYVALEPLKGRTLIDFSRNARRKLDALLCIDILRAVVAGLERGRELGLGHEELAADDVYLLEPLPLNAGNPVVIRVLGWTPRRAETDSEVRGVAAIAAEIFRGRGRSSEDADPLDRVPTPLREVLKRTSGEGGGALPSLKELAAALESFRA
jgi:tetratricopeptide (TPR) repeat protein